MARPTKYTQEYIEKEAEAMDAWFKIPGNVFFNKFVVDREYGPDYISVFAKENDKFRQSCARAKLRQQTYLMEGGLNKTFDSSFCQFTMKNVCRWTDKQVISHETNPMQSQMTQCDGKSKELVNDNAHRESMVEDQQPLSDY